MQIIRSSKVAVVCAFSVLAVGTGADAKGAKEAAGKIPITTSSNEARELYLKGRDLNEKLRATDAHAQFEAAVAKDKDFALAYLGMAQSSGSAKELFAGIDQAVALSGKVSEGERLLIQGAEAGGKGNLAGQKEAYLKLTKAFPNDERAQNLLGGYYFGQQDWANAIAAYQKAVKINPEFSQPYNQLGYAYRFMGKFDDAEKTFKKYIQLIPNDPNPYDSYAELLMKLGRFDESIKSYEKALSVDPNFVASYIGIGNNYMFMGRGEDARKSFGKLLANARNNGEKRQALFWTAMSYVHESATDKALAEIAKQSEVATAAKDMVALSGDYNVMGNILLEAGRTDDAAAKFKLQQETIAASDAPAGVKEQALRNKLFDEGRIALAKNDVATAKARADAYDKAVAASTSQNAFEKWQTHQLRGMIAIGEKNFPVAVKELEQANSQDPRVLYLHAVALQGKGDAKKAREMAEKAANFNGLNGNYGYVRAKARQMLAKS
ncbi:MAG TPA: tetratricopeptide repeat protein [Haliangiales bacterium]|nr:tetratricopeptide repeat protein [Haliangiales bacterium]